jgi:cell division protein FtsI/penicillin-binding protein 2
MRDFEPKHVSWRIYAIFAGIMAAYLVLGARLSYLQVQHGEQYKAWAQGLKGFSVDGSDEARGQIMFRGGEPLAINKKFVFAYASPPDIKDVKKTADAVAAILSLDPADVFKKISKDTLYVPLKDKLGDSEAAALTQANLPGIYTRDKKMRYYPQGNLASQVVGFVDDNGDGQYGLESYYNDQLSGGKDLVLNLDYQLQYQAETILADYVKRLNAREGEAIVVDPKTGAIYAMAQVPNFDPNNYQTTAADSKTAGDLKNNSCQQLFEPGSVFKALTMAGALNDGKVTPDTTYVDTGTVKVGSSTIYNFAKRSYGLQSMTGVLEKSINTGAVYAENKLGNQAFLDYIDKFGVNEATGIDLPETYSPNAEFKKGYAINFDTAAFGQGLWMTSVQLLRAYSAIANGGTLIQPSIVADGRINGQPDQPRVITQETSQTLAKMLQSVVDNGFGKPARVAGYTVCGKTGTAQMSWSTLNINKRGYSDATTQSFVGWFPALDPKFMIFIKLINPQASTAEYSAIPVFHDLAQYTAYLYQVPPDRPVNQPIQIVNSAAQTQSATTTTAATTQHTTAQSAAAQPAAPTRSQPISTPALKPLKNL